MNLGNDADFAKTVLCERFAIQNLDITCLICLLDIQRVAESLVSDSGVPQSCLTNLSLLLGFHRYPQAISEPVVPHA